MTQMKIGQKAEMAGVLRETALERERQHAQWGEQNHPDGTGENWGTAADITKNACKRAFEGGAGTWRDILREEVYEAMAESDPERLRAELLQVAAVAVAWVEAIDRRTK